MNKNKQWIKDRLMLKTTRRNIKRIISLLFIILLVTTLTGCFDNHGLEGDWRSELTGAIIKVRGDTMSFGNKSGKILYMNDTHIDLHIDLKYGDTISTMTYELRGNLLIINGNNRYTRI